MTESTVPWMSVTRSKIAVQTHQMMISAMTRNFAQPIAVMRSPVASIRLLSVPKVSNVIRQTDYASL